MKKSKLLSIVLSLLLIATLVACSAKSESSQPSSTKGDMVTYQSNSSSGDGLTVGNAAQANRKIIMNANAALRVDSIDEAMAEAEGLALQAGGYVKDSYLRENSGRLTLMIPSGKLDSFLLGLESMGKIISKSKSSEDVTDAYFDTEIRIKNLESEIGTMRALLEKQGWKVSEILEIEREIRRLTDELEILKGQLTNMDRKVQYSQLDIEFTTNTTKTSTDSDFANRIRLAFGYGIEALINIVIAVLSVLGFLVPLLPIAIVVYIIWRLIINPIINKRTKK